MSSELRKQKLNNLVDEYLKFKSEGKLDLTSEETIRAWLNEFLQIFGWDVKDTSQILQEKILSKEEKISSKKLILHIQHQTTLLSLEMKNLHF